MTKTIEIPEVSTSPARALASLSQRLEKTKGKNSAAKVDLRASHARKMIRETCLEVKEMLLERIASVRKLYKPIKAAEEQAAECQKQLDLLREKKGKTVSDFSVIAGLGAQLEDIAAQQSELEETAQAGQKLLSAELDGVDSLQNLLWRAAQANLVAKVQAALRPFCECEIPENEIQQLQFIANASPELRWGMYSRGLGTERAERVIAALDRAQIYLSETQNSGGRLS